MYETEIKVEERDDIQETEIHNGEINWLNVAYKIFVVLGIIAIIILILFRHCDCEKCHCHDNTDTSISYDDNLDDSKNKKGNADDLNKKVEEGMITMSMNTDPIFKTGKDKGNLLIENDKSNNYPIMVEIKTKSDGKTIYKSGLIPVGKFVNNAPLSVDLDKGDYPCVAYFNNMDESTGKVLGTGGAEITVHVLS